MPAPSIARRQLVDQLSPERAREGLADRVEELLLQQGVAGEDQPDDRAASSRTGNSPRNAKYVTPAAMRSPWVRW